MLDVYKNNGDIHERTRQEVERGLQREVTRRTAKVVNFGLSYGLTAKGMAGQTGMPVSECDSFMEMFFSRYVGIERFKNQLFQSALSQGCQWSNLFGRTRRMPDLKAQEGWKIRSAVRRLMGSAIQGTAAELTKESLVRINRALKRLGLPAMITNTVHDEIQIDTPEECAREVAIVAQAEMENYSEFSPVPILTDVEIAKENWGKKETLALAA